MSGATVRRINGPLVEVEGLTDAAMADLIEVGPARLTGEIVAVTPEVATAQVFEYTGSVTPGDPVTSLRRPLSALLGPGLLGGVFDGLLRPLGGAPVWLAPGTTQAGADHADGWNFTPRGRAPRQVGPGDLLGVVTGAGSIEHRVLVPAGLAGELQWLAGAGRYRGDDRIATVAGTPVSLTAWWPVRRPRPYLRRERPGAPLLTGQRVIDAVFPLVKGGTAAVPGGFGTGKTVLLQQIAKWSDADVIIYVGCGERGNEMADVVADLGDLVDPRTGGRLAERTVVVANTSNMPIMAREASIYTGVTVAEFYRDMGYDAVVIADSTSRWAEALREFASRSGDLPAEEGYPAGLASALAAFYERAGAVTTLSGQRGSVSVVGAVSPPGGDLTEPVTAHTQRFVRTLWTLDRDLAYARHYPAVAWSGSYCRDTAAVGAWYAGQGDADWAARRSRVVGLLAEADRLAALADLVGIAALPGHERMVMVAGRLLREGVLQQSALSATDSHCTPAKSAALIDMVLDVLATCEGLIAGDVPASAIEEVDFSPAVRAREETGPDDAEGVERHREKMVDRLRELS